VKNIGIVKSVLLSTFLVLNISCTKYAVFSNDNSSTSSNSMNTPTLVADKALNGQGVSMALPSSGGFYGGLYIQPRNLMQQPDTATVGCDQRGLGALGLTSFLSQPSWVTQQVLFQSMNIPTQNFLQGFPAGTSNGLISVDSYFAIDVIGWFHLASTDVEGDYQFAAFADDGVQVSIYNGDSGGQMLVDDEKPASYDNGTCLAQTQPAHLSCTNSWGSQKASGVVTVHLTPGQKVPLEVKYWQGPGQGIALMLVYRQVPTNPAALVDVNCGQQLDFSANGAGLTDLLTRWNVVSFANLVTQ
jgi:hypothetical protein